MYVCFRRLVGASLPKISVPSSSVNSLGTFLSFSSLLSFLLFSYHVRFGFIRCRLCTRSRILLNHFWMMNPMISKLGFQKCLEDKFLSLEVALSECMHRNSFFFFSKRHWQIKLISILHNDVGDFIDFLYLL